MLVNLKQIRVNKGLTLKQLSLLTGISKTYLNDLENLYRINPSKDIVDRLIKVLNVTKNELEGRWLYGSRARKARA